MGLAGLLGSALPTLVLFVLVLARVSGLLMTAPVLSSRLLLVRVRAALAIGIAVALTLVVPGGAPAQAAASLPLPGVLGMCLVEVAVGALIGLLAELIFAAVQLAGQLAGIQIGLGFSNLLDPQSEERVTALAEWQSLMAILFFLAIDGHHMLIRALARSFNVAPAGIARLPEGAIALVSSRAVEIFALAAQIAAPVLVVILMVNAAMGALSKLIPQLNVLAMGFGINILAGFLTLGLSLPFTLRILGAAFTRLDGTLDALLSSLG